MGPSSWHRFFASNFRPKRMKLFCERFGVTPDTRILDVGGSREIWQLLPFRPKVTIVNYDPVRSNTSGFGLIVADARNIPVPSKSFDICFSNSLIEHLWDWDSQRKAADEIRRIGQHYFVETPNFWFPVEPHFLAPAFHWLPVRMRERLAHITPWQLMDRSPEEDLMRLVHELKLLTARKLQRLFPEAVIVKERLCGVAKTLIAIH
jgi:methyltransferase family protein